ncbi:nitrilase-related carbon-nitrogen hydrolase [uncultured Clostridium sp.]|uniref:nitrilase-related carbon-nitrogen hydrolase n=1 Tax=uncultured Clostridium sp. TaxID=59620 RepID=UPI0025DACB4D|nr:nitrilase-related carbon-nitrogen hydrolase [uncultured Clostridium sp.]
MIASYLGPVFIMSYYRKEDSKKSLFIAYTAFFITSLYSFNGVTGIDGILNYLVLMAISIILFMPFIFDALLYRKFKGILSTLVLPVAGVSAEYLFSLISPFGTWGSIAYSQYGNYPLLQLAGITGIYGVSFMVYWTCSFINYLIENKFDFLKVKKVSLIFLGVTCIVYFAGGLRIAYSDIKYTDTVKISSISVPHYELWKDIHNVLDDEQAISDGVYELKSKFNNIHKELFDLTKREAEYGAKIIQWHESNGIVFKEDKDELINEGKQIADEYNIYLLMTVTPIDRENKNDKNQAILIDPDGIILYEYNKYKIVPGDMDVSGDGKIKYADTPYGRVGTAICFDADFPQYVRQAGEDNIDILLVPSSDWSEINPLHSQMASFRGIENGCSVVRQAQKGLCLSTDYRGQTISLMDFFNTEDKVLISNVPVKGVKTIYSSVGDLFSWMCIGTLLLLCVKRGNNQGELLVWS